MELDQLETLGIRGLFLEQTMELLNQSRSGPNAGASPMRVSVPSLRHIVFDMIDEILFGSDGCGCAAVKQFIEQRSSLPQCATSPFRFTLIGSPISVETVRQLMDSRWSSQFIVDDGRTGGASGTLPCRSWPHGEAAVTLRQSPGV